MPDMSKVCDIKNSPSVKYREQLFWGKINQVTEHKNKCENENPIWSHTDYSTL